MRSIFYERLCDARSALLLCDKNIPRRRWPLQREQCGIWTLEKRWFYTVGEICDGFDNAPARSGRKGPRGEESQAHRSRETNAYHGECWKAM